VLALAGCGGRSPEQVFREDSLRPLQQRAELQRARVAATLRVVRFGSRRDARALGEDIDAYAGTVRKIAGLLPPEAAQAPFRRYVSAMRELVRELRRMKAAMGGRDVAVVRTRSQRVQDDVGAVQRGDDELQSALTKDS
jgi:hypothetical protein